jgi:hypothetical protein
VGEDDKVKVGGSVMLRAMVVLAVWVADVAPEVPVTVTVVVAGIAVAAAVKLMVRVWPIVGPKDAVTPAGNPEAASATEKLKPFSALMVMVLAPVAPAFTLRLEGVAERLKLG